MNNPPQHAPAEIFFLDANPGKRFCIYHAPNANVVCQGALLYIHPFGDEMNRSRRVAALQARTLSALGFGVLQVDLFGCGDSSGDFEDARWEIWKDDIALAKSWLQQQIALPVSLWGLRLGALLALDIARDADATIDKLILWQPVIKGAAFLTQFLRLKLVSDMLTKTASGNTGAHAMPENTGTHAMRAELTAGHTLEVAGYQITPALAAAIDAADASEWIIPQKKIHWLEVASGSHLSITPASTRTAADWIQHGVDLQMDVVSGSPFWSTQEITECPDLLTATSQIFSKEHA